MTDEKVALRVAVLAGAVAAGLTACDRIDLTSDDLSRAKAKDIIVNHYGYPREESRRFRFPNNGPEPTHPLLEVLKSDGLITYDVSTRQVVAGLERIPGSFSHRRVYRTHYLYDVTVTESGRKGAGRPTIIPVPIAERRFEAVTGITRENGHASVEYTWRYANPTPFAKHKGELIASPFATEEFGYTGREIDTNALHQARVTLALYDDGWRVVARDADPPIDPWALGVRRESAQTGPEGSSGGRAGSRAPEGAGEPLACDRESSLRSIGTGTPTSIEFSNLTEGTVNISWIDFQGRRVSYRTLRPGGSYVQRTYTSHNWIATNAGGECLGLFRPAAGPSIATVRAGS